MTQAATSTLRYPLPELTRLIEALFAATGMEPDKARAIAHSLLSADSMGHGTHGLALAPWYLEAARSGVMTIAGEMEIVNDRGGCVTWNGRRLPGARRALSGDVGHGQSGPAQRRPERGGQRRRLAAARGRI